MDENKEETLGKNWSNGGDNIEFVQYFTSEYQSKQ